MTETGDGRVQAESDRNWLQKVELVDGGDVVESSRLLGLDGRRSVWRL